MTWADLSAPWDRGRATIAIHARGTLPTKRGLLKDQGSRNEGPRKLIQREAK